MKLKDHFKQNHSMIFMVLWAKLMGIVSNTKPKALKLALFKGDRTQRICLKFKLPLMYRLLPYWKTGILIKFLRNQVFSGLSDVISEQS